MHYNRFWSNLLGRAYNLNEKLIGSTLSLFPFLQSNLSLVKDGEWAVVQKRSCTSDGVKLAPPPNWCEWPYYIMWGPFLRPCCGCARQEPLCNPALVCIGPKANTPLLREGNFGLFSVSLYLGTNWAFWVTMYKPVLAETMFKPT